jgi:two-component system response regulator HydG
MLSEAPWPGNVRELASCIERAVVLGVDERVDANQLSSLERRRDQTEGRPEPPRTASEPSLGWPCPTGTPWSLRRLSRAYTDWVLAGTSGDKVRAAAILGVDLSTLYRWQRSPKD